LLKPGDRSFRAEQVRLVGSDGEQIGVVSLTEARERAKTEGLDLVLVAEQAKPPVCRVMDFGKLLYEQKKNLKSQRKHNLTQKVKEVKFHVNIDKHDFEYKIKHGIEFLGKGYKLKLTIMLRGREMAHKDIAYELMERVIAELEEHGTAENKAKLQGRNISVSMAPTKSGKH
jgi:translation initiation factor IF-3